MIEGFSTKNVIRLGFIAYNNLEISFKFNKLWVRKLCREYNKLAKVFILKLS